MAHDPNNVATWPLHEQAKRLWEVNGGHCVSSMVATLASSYGTHAGLSGDMCDLTETAFELSCPIDDWEEAAREAGYKERDGEWHGQYRSAQDACEANHIEPHQREVFEHWIVSDWLADHLEAHGEKVDKDFAGLTIWARTTTGQAVYADHVIEQIAAETYGREG